MTTVGPAFAACFALIAQTPSTAFNDALVQRSTLVAPEAGAITGSLASQSFGPGDVARGGFVLPGPFEAPEDRGELLVRVFPEYSPADGLSEWGMGWSTSLYIRRQRIRGDIDYEDDGFTSPWGRLEQGSDGFWYPTNLNARVRLSFSPESNLWTAVLSDGTKQAFDRRLDTDRGTFEWHLTSARSVLGDTATLEYHQAEAASERPRIRDVYYGARGHGRAYRIHFDYEQITTPWIRYDSGAPIRLSHRVASVSVSAQSSKSDYASRWSYDLGYDSSPFGPAFYLRRVERRFASGEREPPTVYRYELGLKQLETAVLTHLPQLDETIERFGVSVLQPTRVSTFDAERDGREELEESTEFRTLKLEGGRWSAGPAPPSPPQVDPRCRPQNRKPRTLARAFGQTAEPNAVSALTRDGKTSVMACDRRGVPVSTATVDGDFEFDQNARLFDLNRDFLPDLVRVRRGRVEVAQNVSVGRRLSYRRLSPQNLSPSVRPETSWLTDLNGDGIVDLVVRYETTDGFARIRTWYGTGNSRFTPEGERLRFFDGGAEQQNLSGYGVFFTDVNRDGLADILLTRARRVVLYVFDGRVYRRMNVPALVRGDLDLRNPVLGDFSGAGNLECVYADSRDKRAYSLALNTPQSGLMTSADDGFGTRLTFRYRRAPLAPGFGARPPTLAALEIESSGYGTQTLTYQYGEPTFHSLGRFLVGFDKVDEFGPQHHESQTFLNTDFAAAVPQTTALSDELAPSVVKYATNEYEERSYRGLKFFRLRSSTEGFTSSDGKELKSALVRRYQEYTSEYCPKTVVVSNETGEFVQTELRANPAALETAMHCLWNRRTLTGKHRRSELDFKHVLSARRNPRGQPTHFFSEAGQAPLLLQRIEYDELSRIKKVSSPGKGASRLLYESDTGLLRATVEPDGVQVEVVERDSATDSILMLRTDRGGGVLFEESFRFDGRERLRSAWDNVGGSSESLPRLVVSYVDPTLETPSVLRRSRLVDARRRVYREEVELANARGEAVASVIKIPEGYRFESLTSRSAAERWTREWRRSPVQDLRDLRYRELFQDAVLLHEEIESRFDYVVRSRSLVSAGWAPTSVWNRVRTEQFVTERGTIERKVVENDEFTTRSEWSSAGHKLASVGEAGHTTRFEFDMLGRLAGVGLVDDTAHTIRFDGHGRKKKISRSNLGHVELFYNPSSGLEARREYVGNDGKLDRVVQSEYDTVGRLERTTYSLLGGATSQSLFIYDGDHEERRVPGQRGFLTQVRGPDYARTQLHNADGTVRQVREEIEDWARATQSTRYFEDGTIESEAYSFEGAVATSNVPSVTKLRRVDGYGRPAGLTLNGGPLSETFYDSEGLPSRSEIDRYGTLSFFYDPRTREWSGYELDGTLSSGVTWTENARGLVETESIFTGTDEPTLIRYDYDARGFLSTVVRPDGADSYGYDPSGMLSYVDDVLGAREVERTANEIRAGPRSYSMDALGRVTELDDFTLVYGANGWLDRAEDPKRTIDFRYDETGRRVYRKVDEERTAFVFGGTLTDGRFRFPLAINDVTVGVIDNGQLDLRPFNPRGTALSVPQSRERSASAFGARPQAPVDSDVIDFMNEDRDTDLGTVRFGVRDYDPFLGQWLTPDPLYLESPEQAVDSPVELNLYSYVANDPINYSDPEGTGIWTKIVKIGAKIYKGGSAADAFADNIKDARTLISPTSSTLERVIAGVSLASELSPISLGDVKDGYRLVKGLGKKVDKVSDTKKALSKAPDKGPVHHIATNKNFKSSARGGPWSPRFKKLFDKAGMTFEHGSNKIRVPGHKGPHPKAYHQTVLDRLEAATKGLGGDNFGNALRSELEAIGKEAATPGTKLNKLLTKQPL